MNDYNLRLRILYALVIVDLILGLLLAVSNGFFRKEHSTNIKGDVRVVETQEEIEELERIGVDADSEDLIEVSRILSEYISILSQKIEYERLDKLCLNESAFRLEEAQSRADSKYILDESDCRARVFRNSAAKFKLLRINSLTVDGDRYYCYATFKYPSKSDLFAYYLIYSYEIVQYINIHGVTMNSVAEYIDKSIQYEDFPLISEEVCIPFEKKNGEFVMINDDFVLEVTKGYLTK